MKLVSTLTMTLLAGVFAVPAGAQIIIPRVNAPVVVSPGATTAIYNYTAPNLTFIWDQYPLLPSVTELLPSHFLFCLDRAVPLPCTHANAVFSQLVGSIPSAKLRAPGTFTPAGYRYSFTPAVPDAYLDDVVAWSVSACANMADSSCRVSPITRMIISTWDLKVGNISGNVIAGEYLISAPVQNLGSRTSKEAHVLVMTEEVLVNPATDQCWKTPNDPMIRNELTLVAIDKRGNRTRFADLHRNAAGDFDQVADVRAISRPNAFRAIPAQDNPKVMIGAGSSWLPIRPLAFPVVQGAGSHAYATTVFADSWFELYEPEEVSNRAAMCEVVR